MHCNTIAVQCKILFVSNWKERRFLEKVWKLESTEAPAMLLDHASLQFTFLGVCYDDEDDHDDVAIEADANF